MPSACSFSFFVQNLALCGYRWVLLGGGVLDPAAATAVGILAAAKPGVHRAGEPEGAEEEDEHESGGQRSERNQQLSPSVGLEMLVVVTWKKRAGKKVQ